MEAGLVGERWMRRALRLAERGRATVSPNPMVGCVVVHEGQVVGEGWHERPGGPHAEVAALLAAGPHARGAEVYVTLEPCNHTGRTPPCTQALVRAGVARVVVAVADPNPVARGGADALRAAGVEVEVGLCDLEARQQNAVFFHGLARGRPYVVVKCAVSLDGRIAASDGTSRWLTGEQARGRVHRLRAEVDAILVGSGTVLADDPQLTVRLPDPPGRTDAAPELPGPWRVVLDGRARTRSQHQVMDGSARTLVLTASGARPDGWLTGQAAEVAGVPAAPGGGLDLDAVLEALWQRGIRSVLVEGGAQVSSSFVRAGLADRLEVHVAPLLLGEGGIPAFAGPWATTLAAAPRFELQDVQQAGDDVLLSLVVKDPTPVTTSCKDAS